MRSNMFTRLVTPAERELVTAAAQQDQVSTGLPIGESEAGVSQELTGDQEAWTYTHGEPDKAGSWVSVVLGSQGAGQQDLWRPGQWTGWGAGQQDLWGPEQWTA